MPDVLVATSEPLPLQRPSLSWGAIIGGWLVAMGLAWLFYLLGLAVGFTAFDLSNTDAVDKGLGIGTAIWVVLTWVASLFLGGMFASWMDARPDETVGTLHGVAVWALAITITAILGALGFTNLLQGGASLLHSAATAGATAATQTAGTPSSDAPAMRDAGIVGAELNRAVLQAPNPQAGGAPAASAAAGTSPPETASGAAAPAAPGTPGARGRSMDPATASAVAIDLLRARPDDAKARLVAVTGISPADADRAIQSVSPRVEQYRNELRAAADKARRYANAGLWALFASSLLALVAAAVGGWIGAGHIHRVHGDIARAF
jgi:hypothetical protein